MDKLHIGSLNVRGLRNGLKHRKIYKYLKDHRYDIVLLQETHCTNKDNCFWASEWGNRSIFSNDKSNSAGVAILLTSKVAKSVHEIKCDTDGRVVMVKLQINEEYYGIVNIYAPNHDSPEYFVEMFKKAENMKCDYYIFGGDYNVVIDPDHDRTGGGNYNVNARRIIEEGINKHYLVDVWRTTTIILTF